MFLFSSFFFHVESHFDSVKHALIIPSFPDHPDLTLYMYTPNRSARHIHMTVDGVALKYMCNVTRNRFAICTSSTCSTVHECRYCGPYHVLAGASGSTLYC